MSKLINTENICLQYHCSECCNPVKINSLRLIRTELPFIDLGEILIPEEHPDCIRLKSYHCLNFNSQAGLCDDYSKRPTICRNTECLAFQIMDRKKQKDIIERIKAEKFMRINLTTEERQNAWVHQVATVTV